MTISELIYELKLIMEYYGDIIVMARDEFGNKGICHNIEVHQDNKYPEDDEIVLEALKK